MTLLVNGFNRHHLWKRTFFLLETCFLNKNKSEQKNRLDSINYDFLLTNKNQQIDLLLMEEI